MKILVVDDQAYNRELLASVLEDNGHKVMFGINGEEACEAVEKHPDIDLILMDVVMPVMDGLEATRAIKSKLGEKILPILFVTALDNEDGLTACLEAGGDDFVPKPVSEGVLVSKIAAHQRSKLIYDKLAKANHELKYHRTMMDREHSIVDHIFTQVGKRNRTYCKNFEVYTSPNSLFNGDVVLASPSPSGGAYALVGDFTGHGLAAAMGTLPVSEIFHQNVINQASVSKIASDINQRLEHLLPSNMFFCAAIFEIDYLGQSLTLWMGGMNDLILIEKGEKKLSKVTSLHMPLGILSEEAFDDTPQLVDLKDFGRMYICTDGVIEAENKLQEPFGEERLEKVLLEKSSNTVSELVDAVNAFAKNETLNDDVSIFEFRTGGMVHCSKENDEPVDIGKAYHSAQSVPWDLSISLEGKELNATSVVDQIMAFVSSIQGIELHQDKIFTIVSELYSNSLEHGVLGLDSSLKATADGFEEYYNLRQSRLEKLEDQFIHIQFKFLKGNPNSVELCIEDSGQGFDIDAVNERLRNDEDAHGRGLTLLASLCSELEYSNHGKTVRAVYELTRH